METSLLEHLDESYVRPEEFDRAAAGAAAQWGEWQSGVNLTYDSAEFTDSGVVGDPRDGSADIGAKLLAAAAESLAALLETVEERD